MKYPKITFGRVEAVWNKLGGEKGVDKFLSNKLVVVEPACRWREKNGVIYFSVTSDGTTGEEWIKRLEKKGFRVGDYTKNVLRSSDFQPTKGVMTEVAVLRGILFTSSNRTTSKIQESANKRKLQKPNAEVACLILEMFSNEDLKAMDLCWIVVFHEPIKDSSGSSRFLNICHEYDGRRWLNSYYSKPNNKWHSDGGFAFATSQVSL